MIARRQLTAADLAGRLRHAGIDVREAVEEEGFCSRVHLANGLTVKSDEDGFPIVLAHCFDPISTDVERELHFCDSVFDVPRWVHELAPTVHDVRRAMHGDRRDVVAEVRKVVGERQDLSVVGSDRAVPGALAVSMTGLRFSALLNDVRFTSMLQVDTVLRTHRQIDGTFGPLAAFLPFDVEGHHLTVQARGLESAILAGTVQTSRGDEWFTGHFDRLTSPDGHEKNWSIRCPSLHKLSTMLPTSERIELYGALANNLDALYATQFPVFAQLEVHNHERDVRMAQREVAAAKDRDVRRDWLRRERRALARVAEAQAIAREGRVPQPNLDQEIPLLYDAMSLF